jgi:hypothetical protein
MCAKHNWRVLKYGDPHTLSGFWHCGGEHNPNWQGDEIGYSAVHCRLRRNYGRASIYHCVDCGRGTRADDWSYDGTDPNEKTDPTTGLKYSTDIDRYVPRCKPCHARFDRRDKTA